MGFFVKPAKNGLTSSITWMCSEITMQVAFSSVNCGSKPKPSAPKNATVRSRFSTGRLTNNWRDFACVDIPQTSFMQLIIHGLPKRSVKAPQRIAQKVSASGICT